MKEEQTAVIEQEEQRSEPIPTPMESDAEKLIREAKERGPFLRAAEFKPGLFNAETRTAEIVWTTGAKVKRSGFFADFEEELKVSSDAVRLDRLNSGAPLLKNHDATDITNVIGVVERAWLDKNEGRALVRFSDRPEIAGIVQDVQNGILRGISVGYRVHKFEETSQEDAKVRSFLATDWEPLELSIVAIPADQAAGFRSEELAEDCKGEEAMQEQKKPESVVDIEALKKEGIEAERSRATGIIEAVRKAKLEESFAQEMIAAGVSLDQARASIIDKIAEQAQATKTTNHVRVEVGTEERDNRLAGAETALLHRYNASKYAMEERGHDFVGKSLVEVAREFCEKNGIRTRGMSASMIAERALHTTSDFPLLLANVAGKSLRDAYAEAPATYAPIVREVELPDFKEVTRVQLGDAPSLEEVLENGEYKRGSIGEAKEGYKLSTFGKVIAVSRKTIINDDLQALTRVPALLARAAADLISDKVWEIFGSNPMMGDGVALFHANHGNLGTAAAISIDSLGEARAKMRKQTGLGGRLINVQASSLIVPAALETKAQQFIASVAANQSSQVNPFSGSMAIIAEPRLDGYSQTAWYLAASPAAIDIIELAYLSGARGPQVSTREGFDVDGMEIKVMLDFATKAIDHRGLFKNAGL